MKEKCVCEICVCGRHHCKQHGAKKSNVKLEHKDESVHHVTEYEERYRKVSSKQPFDKENLGNKKRQNNGIDQTSGSKRHKVMGQNNSVQTISQLPEGNETSIYKNDYVGENPYPKAFNRPKTTLQPPGMVEGYSENADTYTGEHGERGKRYERNDTKILNDGYQKVTSSVATDDYDGTYGKSAANARPTTTERFHGDFQKNSVYKGEYTGEMTEKNVAKKPGDQIRRAKDRFQDATTSKEYNGEFGPKARNARPSTTNKFQGNFQENSRYRDEYLGNGAEKYVARKPNDSIQRPNVRFQEGTTSNDYDGTYGERASRMRPTTTNRFGGDFQEDSSYKDEYQGQKIERKIAARPKDNMKNSGDRFNDETTSKDYTGQYGRKADNARPMTTARFEGDMHANSNYIDDYTRGNVDRNIASRPKDNLRPTKERVEDRTTSHDYDGAHGSKAFNARPSTTTKFEGNFQEKSMYGDDFVLRPTRRKIAERPNDNIVRSKDKMASGKTSQDYDGAGGQKAKNARPMTTSRFEGDFTENTNYENDYISKSNERSIAARPKDNIQRPNNMMQVVTTSEDYDGKYGKRAKNARPTTTARFEGDFQDASHYKKDYIQRQTRREVAPKPKDEIQRASDKIQDNKTSEDYDGTQGQRAMMARPTTTTKFQGNFQENTMYRNDYVRRENEKNIARKPKDNIQRSEDKMLDRTTSNDYDGVEGERMQNVRPMTTNKFQGDIQSNTMYRDDYIQGDTKKNIVGKPKDNIEVPRERFQDSRTSEDYAGTQGLRAVKANRPKNNIKRPTGQIDPKKTSDDYDGTAGPRAGKTRPSTTNRFQGDFQENTRHKDDFSRQDTKKEIAGRPTDNIQRSNDKMLERTTSNDYNGAIGDKARHTRPMTTSKFEGKLDENSSYRDNFVKYSAERNILKKPKDNITASQDGQVNETTSKADFKLQQGRKAGKARPSTTVRFEGKMGDGTTIHESAYKAPKFAEKQISMRPQTSQQLGGTFHKEKTSDDYKLHQVEKEKHGAPTDNLPIRGQFKDDVNATTRDDYRRWEVQKAVVKRNGTSLKNEGKFSHETTNKADFIGTLKEKTRAVRPGTTLQQEGELDCQTTHASTYKGELHEKARSMKPKNEKFEVGEFRDETSHKSDFVGAPSDRAKAVKHKPNIAYNGKFDSNTAYKEDYTNIIAPKFIASRPKSQHEWKNGDIDTKTTNKTDYQQWKVVDDHNHNRHRTELKVSNNKFIDQTTSKSDYQHWEYPSKVDSNRVRSSLKHEGVHNFETTSGESYKVEDSVRREKFRPSTTLKLQGKLDSQTTHKQAYRGEISERATQVINKNEFRLVSNHSNLKKSRSQSDLRMPRNTSFASEYTHIDDDEVKKLLSRSKSELELLNNQENYFETNGARTTRPKSELKVGEGEFDHETSNRNTFQYEPSEKRETARVKSSLRLEGERRFETTSKMMLRGNVVGKPEKIRPQSELKLGDGKFYDETTNKLAHQYCVGERRHAIKLKSSLRNEGDHHFQTTNSAEFNGMQGERANKIRPATTLRQNGQFESAMSQKNRFSRRLSELSKLGTLEEENSKNLPNTEVGKFESRTEKSEEYHLDGLERREAIRRNISLKHEGERDFKTVSKINEVSYQSSKDIETAKTLKPQTTLKNEGTFEGTTNKAHDFTHAKLVTSKVARPSTTLKLDGNHNFTTTKASDFTGEIINERLKGTRPSTTLRYDGKFEGISTKSFDYNGEQSERVVATRPKSELNIEGEHTHETENDKAYPEHKIMNRNKAVRPSTTLRNTGQFEGITTKSSDYNGEQNVRVKAIRPKSELKIEGEHTHETENYKAYQNHKIVNQNKAVRPSTTLRNTGKFEGVTTKSSDYDGEQNERVKSIRPKSEMKIEGEHTHETENYKAYQNHKIMNQNKAVRPSTTLRNTGQFEGITTKSSDYNGEQNERVKAIRPKSELKIEGEHTHETENYKAYQNHKIMNQNKAVRPSTTLRNTGQFEGITTKSSDYNGEQNERVKSIRPKSELKIEGEHTHETENDKAYQIHKIMNQNKAVRPSTTLRNTGQFEGVTTKSSDYNRQQNEKVKAIRPKSELKIEGEHTHETENDKAYQNHKIMNQNKAVRPSTTLRNTGQFEGITTKSSDYNGEQNERVKSIKPKSELKIEGEHTHETENNKAYQNYETMNQNKVVRPSTTLKITGQFEGVTTKSSDYNGEQSERIKSIRPQSKLKFEGEHNHETENGQTYQSHDIIQHRAIRPSTNLKNTGQFEDETTNALYYNGEQYERAKSIRPQSELKIEGEHTHVTENSKIYQKHVMTRQNKAIRPSTTLKSIGQFEGMTTKSFDYNGEQSERVKLIRPQSELKFVGEHTHKTENDEAYQNHNMMNQNKAVRPSTTLKNTGEFEGTTTASSNYSKEQSERVKAIRPQSELKIEGEHTHVTENSQNYQSHVMTMQNKAVRPSTTLKNVGQFEGVSTKSSDFKVEHSEKVKAIRPQSELKIEGEHTYETENNMAYQNFEMVDQYKAIRPSTTLKNAGQFDGVTTKSSDYNGEKSKKVKVIRPQSQLKIEGEFSHETQNSKTFQNHENVSQYKAVRPSTTLKNTGKFEGKTTKSIDYNGEQSERVKAIKPQSELIIEGKHTYETENSKAFQNYEATSRYKAVRPSRTLKNTGEFEGVTTKSYDYNGEQSERVKVIRPQSELKIEGEFTHETQNSKIFQNHENVSQYKAVRPSTTLKNTGKFETWQHNKKDAETNRVELVDEHHTHESLHKVHKRKTWEKWDSSRGKIDKETSNESTPFDQSLGHDSPTDGKFGKINQHSQEETTNRREFRLQFPDSIEDKVNRILKETSIDKINDDGGAIKEEATKPDEKLPFHVQNKLDSMDKIKQSKQKFDDRTTYKVAHIEHEMGQNFPKDFKTSLKEGKYETKPLVNNKIFHSETTNRREFKVHDSDSMADMVNRALKETALSPKDNGKASGIIAKERVDDKGGRLEPTDDHLKLSDDQGHGLAGSDNGFNTWNTTNKRHFSDHKDQGLLTDRKIEHRHLNGQSNNLQTPKQINQSMWLTTNDRTYRRKESNKKLLSALHPPTEKDQPEMLVMKNGHESMKIDEKSNMSGTKIVGGKIINMDASRIKRAQFRENMTRSNVFNSNNYVDYAQSNQMQTQLSQVPQKSKSEMKTTIGGDYEKMPIARIKIHRPQSSKIFGDRNERMNFGSVYSSAFDYRQLKPCPAGLLQTSASKFQYRTEKSGHQYYLPVIDG